MVARAARSYFSFLADSKAHVSIVLGDARLSLEHEPGRRFDLLVVDAFSGDSIPVHLLTKEAFEEYGHHLNPGGVLAIHISNSFLDLAPVVGNIAAELGDSALFVRSKSLPDQQVLGSDWVLVSADKEFLTELQSSARGTMLGRSERRLWTDQYSNLLGAFK
jgi:spermidine synthase